MPTPTSISNHGVSGNYEQTEYIRNGNNNYTGIIISSTNNSVNPTTTVNRDENEEKNVYLLFVCDQIFDH